MRDSELEELKNFVEEQLWYMKTIAKDNNLEMSLTRPTMPQTIETIETRYWAMWDMMEEIKEIQRRRDEEK